MKTSKQKVNKEIFINRLQILHGNKFILVGDYIDYYTQTTFKCNICNNLFISKPKSLIDKKDKKSCRNCYSKKRNVKTITKEIFIERLNKKYPNEYILTGEYKGYDIETIFKHITCGNNYYLAKPKDIIEKKGTAKCNLCANNRKKSFSTIQKELLKLGYEIQSDESLYKNNKTKLVFKRLLCKHIFESRINDIKNEICVCPICNPSSINEIKISEFLNLNKIQFETQKTFSTCRNKKPLLFDFYIPEYKLLLEYDGAFHYKNIKGEDILKEQQVRDNIKNNWVKDQNDISLIRINYKQDLNKILNDIFIKNEIDKDVFFIDNY